MMQPSGGTFTHIMTTDTMISSRTKAHELEELLPWNWKTERLGATAKA
jgi:hypothetical protein